MKLLHFFSFLVVSFLLHIFTTKCIAQCWFITGIYIYNKDIDPFRFITCIYNKYVDLWSFFTTNILILFLSSSILLHVHMLQIDYNYQYSNHFGLQAKQDNTDLLFHCETLCNEPQPCHC